MRTSSKPVMSLKRFAVTYVLLMAALFLVLGWSPIQNIVDVNGLYSRSVATLTCRVLEMLGVPNSYQGSVITLPSVALDVKFGCNGLEAVLILGVAIIAFPALWRYKMLGVATGFVVLQVVNILRIAALAYSAVNFERYFDYVHTYIAQGMMIALSLGIFLIYIRYANNLQKANP
jgi:exosortase H (IPTLxxWG-CTERM-specific)